MNNKRSAAGRSRGYTLVELMTAVSIAGVLAALALPAFERVISDNRRTVVVNEVLATVQLARSEAAKRGQTLVVCGIDDANANGTLEPAEQLCTGYDWSDGWMVGTWRDADADNRVDAGELAAPSPHLNDYRGAVSVRAGNFTATPPVAPAGTAAIKTFGQTSSNGTITVCDRRGSALARAVIIAPNGRARVSARKADGSALSCP